MMELYIMGNDGFYVCDGYEDLLRDLLRVLDNAHLVCTVMIFPTS